MPTYIEEYGNFIFTKNHITVHNWEWDIEIEYEQKIQGFNLQHNLCKTNFQILKIKTNILWEVNKAWFICNTKISEQLNY